MPYVNLKGEPLDLRQMMQDGYRQRYAARKAGAPPNRKPIVKNGYAAPPGTGPAGMTCKDCQHKKSMSNGGAKHFIKCELRRATWTHGEGTDIRASSPACNKFEGRTP